MDRSVVDGSRVLGPSDLLLVGAGGLIGSALARRCGRRIVAVRSVEWRADDAGDRLAGELERFCATRSSGVIVWCAGAGVIGSDDALLTGETEALRRLLEAVAGRTRFPVVMTSSAGGVHGGASAVPITEDAAPSPLSGYGENKLAQERLIAEWAATTGGSAVVARVSTAYGPGQALDKGQGLISLLCKSAVTRQPVSLFVALDTLRDFIYVDDLAVMLEMLADRAARLERGSVVTKILASQRSISLGGVIGEMRRVCPRPPIIVMGSSPNRRAHGRALVFRSRVWTDLDRRVGTPLPVGIRATYSSIHSLAASTGALAGAGR